MNNVEAALKARLTAGCNEFEAVANRCLVTVITHNKALNTELAACDEARGLRAKARALEAGAHAIVRAAHKAKNEARDAYDAVLATLGDNNE